VAGADANFASDDVERDDFVPLVFTREGDALGVAFLFAAMGHIYVNWRLTITQAAIGSRLPHNHCQRSASAPLHLEHIIRPAATAPAILF